MNTAAARGFHESGDIEFGEQRLHEVDGDAAHVIEIGTRDGSEVDAQLVKVDRCRRTWARWKMTVP